MFRAALTACLLSVSISMWTSNRVYAQASSAAIAPAQTIVLPLELVANQPATLAALSADGHVMPSVKLVLSDGELVTTDESGRAHFLAPPEPGLLYVRIPESETRAVADVLATSATVDGLKVSGMQSFVTLKDPFSVYGTGFQGDADQNKVEVEDQPALVLASSPVELIVLVPPSATPGAAPLTVKSAKAEIAMRTTLVNVTSDTVEQNVKQGEKMPLSLHVTGTMQPAVLRVDNLSPQIAQFKLKHNQSLKTSGGEDNSATMEVKGLRAGQFSFRVELAPPSGTPDVAAARVFLDAAQKIAPENQRNLIGDILKKLRPQAINVAGARRKFEKLSMDGDSGDVLVLLRAGRRALLGE